MFMWAISPGPLHTDSAEGSTYISAFGHQTGRESACLRRLVSSPVAARKRERGKHNRGSSVTEVCYITFIIHIQVC